MSKFSDTLKETNNLSTWDRIKAHLDESSYEDFIKAIEDQGVSAAAICRALKSLGFETSAMTIQRMRNK